MKLSDEQMAILENKEHDLLVNAFAGSGKTSTVMKYIDFKYKYNKKSRILVLVFNKSASQDMQNKAKKYNFKGATFSTIHSFAFRNMIRECPKYMRNVCNNIKIADYKEFLNNRIKFNEKEGYSIKKEAYERKKFPATKLIVDAFTEFCKSDKTDMKKFLNEGFSEPLTKHLNELDLQKGVVEDCLLQLEKEIFNPNCRLSISHDFYLKYWHKMSKYYDFNYDEIIIDEAQDTTKCTIDLVLGQKRPRHMFIGDRFQQIYGWNGCINSFPMLEKMGIPSLYLSQSYRCPDRIAKLARPYLAILGAKTFFRGCETEQKDDGLTCYLCRTNAKILEALDIFAKQGVPAEKICMYGGKSGYNFGDIEDAAYLFLNEKDKIRSSQINFFGNFDSYYTYAKMANDISALRACDFILKRGPSHALRICKNYKNANFLDTPEYDCIVLSTGHKSKGSEFATVYLMNDFWNYNEQLDRNKERPLKKGEERILKISFDELRLLYVALTRAKCNLSDSSLARYNLPQEDLTLLYRSLIGGRAVGLDKGQKYEDVDMTQLAIAGIEKYSDMCQENFQKKIRKEITGGMIRYMSLLACC